MLLSNSQLCRIDSLRPEAVRVRLLQCMHQGLAQAKPYPQQMFSLNVPLEHFQIYILTTYFKSLLMHESTCQSFFFTFCPVHQCFHMSNFDEYFMEIKIYSIHVFETPLYYLEKCLPCLNFAVYVVSMQSYMLPRPLDLISS